MIERNVGSIGSDAVISRHGQDVIVSNRTSVRQFMNLRYLIIFLIALKKLSIDSHVAQPLHSQRGLRAPTGSVERLFAEGYSPSKDC
jgi:hypothetical protein